jgi:hypothetical protein
MGFHQKNNSPIINILVSFA